MKLKQHYEDLWRQSIQVFNNEEFQVDPFIDSGDDTRYGITLLARPSAQIKSAISNLLEEIRSVAPVQYYYPPSDMHLTVLSIISCYPGFSPEKVNTAEYIRLISSVAEAIKPFRIRFDGLTASPSCILIRGFPENNQLTNLRDGLRKQFAKSPLQHSIDKRYYIQSAHITAIRFRQPFVDSHRFIEKITALKDTYFGTCRIDELELMANDWYQRNEKVELIKGFKL